MKITDTSVDNLGVNEDIKGTLYFYYQLDNFYQNHRRFVKSQNVVQLRGEGSTVKFDALSHNCDPVTINKHLWDHQKYSVKGRNLALKNKEIITDPAHKDKYAPYKLRDEDVAYPCGLIARSVFNDTFQLMRKKDGKTGSAAEDWEEIKMNTKGIAW